MICICIYFMVFGLVMNTNARLIQDVEREKETADGTAEHKAQEQHEVWRTVKEVLSSKVLVVRGIILFFIWATDAFVFYGLSLNATSLSGNKYVNFILVCLVEIPGYTLSWFTMNSIGRRWSLAGSLLLCAFTCAAGGFISHGTHILHYIKL